jgi:hypothetical protein
MFPINLTEVMIGSTAARFDKEGVLTDELTKDFIRQLLSNLVEWTQRIGNNPDGTGSSIGKASIRCPPPYLLIQVADSAHMTLATRWPLTDPRRRDHRASI